MKNIPIFVIHVHGNQERREHIERELHKKNLSFDFILKGNQKDLTKSILKKYFRAPMDRVTPGTSCAYKHILVYQKMLKEKIKQALIFEDDIVLYDDFLAYFDKICSEIERKKLRGYLVSLDDYSLKVITKSKKNQFLYPKKSGRGAGSYIVDFEFACSFMHFVEKEKCHLPIDHMHNTASSKSVINIYWAHPGIT